MKYESYSNDMSLFNQKSEEQMSILSAIGSVLLGEIKADDIPFIKELKCVKEFLESPINDSNEASLKKVFSTAIIIANEKDILPFQLPDSTEEIASLVDDGLTRLKVAFKEQTGEIDVYEAADILVDRVAARSIAIIEDAIEVGVPILADKLEKLAMTNSYTVALAPFVKPVMCYVAEPVKNILCNGIKIVAEKTKPILRRAIETTTTILSTVTNKFKKLIFA